MVGTAEAGGDRAVTGATVAVTGMGIARVVTQATGLDTGPASVTLTGKICTKTTATSRAQHLLRPWHGITPSPAA